ncbi:unnamed protein product [Schistosoma haematobium]|nr:unnamed protein product [Schistosoma haematobium]
MFGDRQLSVISPATRDKEVFKWIPCRPGEIKDENSEIVDVISWVVSDVKEMSENPTLVELLKETDRSSYDDVSKLCDVYNKAIIDLWDMWIEENTVPEFFNRKASRGHVQFILLQCYNRAVSDPDKLNQYPPFSPQVYGETSFELISQMIDTIAVTSDDVFIDLGSGVGQVVLQVCASTDAKFCYGIEKAEYPANCASRLDSTFRHWMSFYGKSYRPYTLERGDFLSAEYQEKITNAGVLFANNFAFGPEVDHQLKQRFANLKEGARIISSKAFCPLNFRITDRNLGDIGSIMRVSCLNPIQDAVSWTDKPFSYYVHTIDRSLLEQYFARLKNPKSKNENRTVRRDRKGRVISEATMREGSIQLTLNASGNNQHNTNGNVSHKAKRSSTIIKHRSSTSRCLPNRSASLPAVTASSPSELISVKGRKLSSQNYLSKNETISRQITNGSMVVHRIKQCESPHLQSELKRSHVHHKDNQSPLDIFTLSKDTSNAGLVESHVDTQLASLTSGGPIACDNNEDRKQFRKVIQHLLDDPCESHSLSKSDNIKQSVRRKSKTIENDNKLTFNYPIIDDYLSLHSSSCHDQRDSRNSSSSPYVSSLSSANRSPNSQIDEITSLNSLTKRSDLELKSVQSPDLSIFPENKLDKDKHEDSFHIRIKFKISNSPSGQNHPVSVKIKPPCNGDNTPNRLSNPENSNDTCDTNVINKDHPNSVANRRILRKCRQMLSDDSSSLNVTNFKNSNNRTIALRKRMQNHFMDSGNRNKSPSVHSNSCKTNNKLKYTRRYSLDKLSHNMNVLHDYTVTHVQSQLTPTQFGLNDKRFPTYTCHYQPVDVYTESSATQLSDSNLSDPHTGYNKAPVPFALTQYLELTKQAFMDHFAMLHSPAYASTIQSELEREHNRQAELLKHTKFLEQSIAKLHSDGTDLLNRFTKRLGILITTPAAFFSQARRLIKQHHVLEEKIAEFRRQISLLSSANQELVRRHHIEAARLLATATAIKSDNSFQNQHPTLNKLICSGNDVKVTEINKNGFHYNSDNMLPSSTSSESNYRNAISLNSVVIPPPPSLTKVSHNTLNCNKFGIPSIATSDNLVSAHEMNQQHSLNPIKSSNIKLRTSNGAPSVLRNNTDVHRFAPVLIKTVNTSNHSAVSVHTTNNKADRDHKVITDNSNNHNNTNNTTNNGTNHRIDKHMNIPPPPPLLPMHIHSDVYVDGALSSAKSPTDFNKHKYCNSNNNPSLLPELNRSFITCRTDYDMSLIQSNYRSHTKSMHASLQDLILDEFSRETPCISVSNCPTVTKTNKNRNVYSMSDSSYSCQYENNPDPLFQRHNHHNHNHKILHPNYIDYSHQLNLPPRKRHWDSSNYNPTTTNNYGEECEPPKLSRECKSTDMET